MRSLARSELRDSETLKMVDDEKPFFVQGDFRIKYKDDDTEEWNIHFEKQNVIVNGARKIMSHLIGDCYGSSLYGCINQFRIGGDNSLLAAEMLNPTSPTATDTDIVYSTNLFTRNRSDTGPGSEDLFTVSYPDEPDETSVLFTIDILKTEANVMEPDPSVFICSGLFAEINSNFVLFASQSWPVLTKLPSRQYRFEWSIRF